MRTDRRARVAFITAVLTISMTTPVLGDDSAAKRSLKAGHGFLQRGLVQMALTEYEAALGGELDAASADEARYGLAVCYAHLARWDAVLESLDSIRGGSGFAFADDCAMLRGQSLMMMGRYAEAAKALEGLASKADTSDKFARARALRVECLYRAGDEAGAIDAWESGRGDRNDSDDDARAAYFAARAMQDRGLDARAAETLEPYASDLRAQTLGDHRELLRGRCLDAAGRRNEAQACYERVAAIDDSAVAPDAMLAGARLRRDLGDEDVGVALLERLVARHPDSSAAALAELDLAAIALKSADVGRARALATHAMTTGGAATSRDATLLLAQCDEASGRHADAADRLRSLVEREPDPQRRAMLVYELGCVLWRGGELERASAELTPLADAGVEPTLRADAMASLIAIAQERGDDKALAELCETFAESFPDDPRRLHSLLIGGAAHERAGDYEAAEQQYRRVMADRDRSLHDDAALRLGLMLRSLGRADDAMRVLERFDRAELATRHAPALLALGDLNYQSGDLDRARALLERYLQSAEEGPGLADAMLTLGLILGSQGDHEAARDILARRLNDWSEARGTPTALLALARAQMALGRLSDAIDALEQARGGEDDSVRESALRHLGALASESGDHRRAAALFREAGEIEGAAHAMDSRLRGAQSLCDAGLIEQADALFTALVDDANASPISTEALTRRGLLRLANAHPEQGLADIDRALESLPQGPLRSAALLARASAHFENQPGRARADLEAALTSGGDDAQLAAAHYELARLDAREDRHESTLEHLQEAEHLMADLPDAARLALAPGLCLLKATTLQTLGRHEDALSETRRYLEQFPDGAMRHDALLLGGDAARDARRLDDAVAMYRRASEDEHSETSGIALLRLGDVLGQAQQWKASDRAFAQYLERFPDSERWFAAAFGRGWALENSGDPEGALVWYRRVADNHRGATAARAQFQIGECLYAMGEHEHAIRELLKVDVLYESPEWSAAALYEAARCYGELGDHEASRKGYEEVVARFAGTDWASLAARAIARGRED